MGGTFPIKTARADRLSFYQPLVGRLIDLDPVRPSGISATDEEHELALAKARDIISDLETRGWPAPAERLPHGARNV